MSKLVTAVGTVALAAVTFLVISSQAAHDPDARQAPPTQRPVVEQVARVVPDGSLTKHGPHTAAPSAAPSAKPSAPAPGKPTARVVVRPVHADGTPVAGYTVTAERDDGFTCETTASRVSVSDDVHACGSSATDTTACWRSTGLTVLCLRDPSVRALVRIRYEGSFVPVRAVKSPVPQRLVLAGGPACLIRVGGAWPQLAAHPDWSGGYFCDDHLLYGPAAHNGIDVTTTPWTVHVVSVGADHRVGDLTVQTAYLVGTAR